MAQHYINVDLARVFETADRGNFLRMKAWGDLVEVEEITADHVRIKTFKFAADGTPQPISGFIKPARNSGLNPQTDIVKPVAESDVLKLNFVDVQQGDGSVIETPRGKVVLIDGGDNQLFARYLAGRFRGTDAQHPRAVDAIVVTHGDADHFVGLVEIAESEAHPFPAGQEWKRLFIDPERVYHSGLVKRPSGTPEGKMFGATTEIGGKTIITELESDLLAVPDAKMNRPFRRWRDALRAYNDRRLARAAPPVAMRRLAHGDDDAFDFLQGEGITVEVLGPLQTTEGGVTGLRFLGEPPSGPRIGHTGTNPANRRFSGKSPSHTINGHSIILRLNYGNFRCLFAGDLNEEAEADLVAAHAPRLRAEVFKAPHHGSADFSPAFIEAVAPVISVVSSGDESVAKEYIHPRATLMGALGRYARAAEPLIFVTELAAFFEKVGHATTGGAAGAAGGESFFAFRRTSFGLVKMRTDGKRLLAYTDSGNVKLKEAYAYTLPDGGDPVPAAVRQA